MEFTEAIIRYRHKVFILQGFNSPPLIVGKGNVSVWNLTNVVDPIDNLIKVAALNVLNYYSVH